MHDLFAKAADRLFARLGVAATYCPNHGDNPITLNVILKTPDYVGDFGQMHVHTSTQTIDVKCCDVKQPCVGDVVIVNQTTYRIQSEPVRDQHGLLWKLDVVKCT